MIFANFIRRESIYILGRDISSLSRLSPSLAISNFLTLPLPVSGMVAGTPPSPSQKMCVGALFLLNV